MRILFVTPLNHHNIVETTFPHLGLGYLASTLKLECPAVQFRVVTHGVDQTIREWKPDLVGISSVSQYWNEAKQAAYTAKQYGLPVVAGGIHVSCLPQTMTMDMDVGIMGEGEQVFTELVKGFMATKHLSLVPGTVALQPDGMLLHGPDRDVIPDLDALPLPDRSFQAVNSHTSMFTSRGCPYACKFCASTRYWDKVRFFSAEYVVEEILYLYHHHHVSRISFLDDLFIADRKRLERIYELLGRYGMLGKLRYICNVRSNLVTDALCRQLVELGVDCVGIGMESACPSTLAYLKGQGNITVHDHANALDILRHHGIVAHPSFIIGSPWETREDIMETYRFIKHHHVPDFEIYVLMPFPGTPVWDYAQLRGLAGPDMNWQRLQYTIADFGPDSIVLSETMEYRELWGLYQQFVRLRKLPRLKDMLSEGIRHPAKAARYVYQRVCL